MAANELDNRDSEQGSSAVTSESEKKIFDAYSNLPRGLTAEELTQSGTQKLILNDLARSESKVKELEPFRNNYYTVLTEKSVLQEKLLKIKRAEILYSFCTTIGGVIIGLAKLFLETSWKLSAFMFLIGAALIIGGIFFKTSYKK